MSAMPVAVTIDVIDVIANETCASTEVLGIYVRNGNLKGVL